MEAYQSRRKGKRGPRSRLVTINKADLLQAVK